MRGRGAPGGRVHRLAEDETTRLTPAPASAAAAMTRTAAAERRPLERREGPGARLEAAGPYGGWPYGGWP